MRVALSAVRPAGTDRTGVYAIADYTPQVSGRQSNMLYITNVPPPHSIVRSLVAKEYPLLTTHCMCSWLHCPVHFTKVVLYAIRLVFMPMDTDGGGVNITADYTLQAPLPNRRPV